MPPAANTASPATAFGLLVRWDTSRRERNLYLQEATWPQVMQLLTQTATALGRRDYLEAPVEGIERPLLRVPLDFTSGRMVVEIFHPRAVLLNDRVHRAMRAYIRGTMARLIRRRDFTDRDGIARSEIIVCWDEQRLPASQQLKALDAALASQDPLRIEAAWFGLTQRAYKFLTVGRRAARRLRLLQDFCGETEVSAQVIPVLMLSPDLLAMFMPFALHAASKPGRRPVHDRDEALNAVFNVFADVAGTDDPMAWKPRHDEPVGLGADFVRRIEEIFEVELMPPGSTHALRRAYARQVGGGG